MTERVTIIGSGPAGWTAAIYTGRANLEPLVYEGAFTEDNRLKGTLPLGQLALTTEVENFPGFPAGDMTGYLDSSIEGSKRKYMAPHGKHGVSGPELMELMRQQAVNFGARIKTDDIVELDLSKRPFRLKSLAGDEFESHSIIVATGARANYLGLPSEERFKNFGVSACAVCDGALPRLPQSAGCGCGRWRQRHGRGHIPHQVCINGLPHPSTRLFPSQQDYGGTSACESQDSGEVEFGD